MSRFFKQIEKKLFAFIDIFITWKHLITVVLSICAIVLFLYFFKYNTRSEDVLTYIYFGIVTVMGFILSHRILFYIRPICDMEEYVKYLIEVLRNTHKEDKDDVIILASTPNPGLSDYLMEAKNGGPNTNHYYLKYCELLKQKVREGCKIKYRILNFGSIKTNNGSSTIVIHKNSDMMNFLKPFIRKLDLNDKKSYMDETKNLLVDIKPVLIQDSPYLKENKGFLVIYHRHLGFLGVYDATGGALKIRGIKVAEPIFLNVLKEINNIIKG